MTTGRRKRTGLQTKTELLAKLEEVAQREEVHEEFELLGKRGVPLSKQPPRATPEQIDARTIAQFRSVAPTELLEDLIDDEPPSSGTRTARALGRLETIVAKAQQHSRRTHEGLRDPERRDKQQIAKQEMRRELVAALREANLKAGSRTKSKDAGDYLDAKRPHLRGMWDGLSKSRRRDIMLKAGSQKVDSGGGDRDGDTDLT